MIDTVSIEDEWLLDMARRLGKMQNDLMDFGDALFVVAGDERDWPPSIPKPKGHKWAEWFDKPMPGLCDDCANCLNRGNCGGPNPAMKWCASRMPEKPVEGMADLHGTTGGDACLFTADQIEAAGFVRKEDMDKAINALRSELMPEIRRAQYPKANCTVTQPRAPSPAPRQLVAFTSNGDGTFHAVWDDGTDQDMIPVAPSPTYTTAQDDGDAD